MYRIIIFSALLLSVFNFAQAESKSETVADTIIYSVTNEEFSFVKDSIESAITSKGYSIRGRLHISGMLERTQKIMKVKTPLYSEATVVEFCSASLSHAMTQLHPANITACPLTISLYTLMNQPERIQIAFRKPRLAGNAEALTQKIESIFHSIIQEAVLD
jgi:hypothetical protein